MNIQVVQARDLSDAWYQCLAGLIREGHGRKYRISGGSYVRQWRLEYEFVVVSVRCPGVRPLLPQPHNVPWPADERYLEQQYLAYLITDVKQPDEQYTYGEYLQEQIQRAIEMYKEQGHGTNQVYMTVGNEKSLWLSDPPCLRGIDTAIREGKLCFFVYFRSWDLWGGFPVNLAALQLLKEYMAVEIGVEDGELVAVSKGLHLYDHCWGLARRALGIYEK